MNIPFFPYNKTFLQYKENFKNILDEIIDNGQFILGNNLEEFENNIANQVGCKFCLGVANATDALEMMVEYNNFTNKDEIILSSHTMIATLSSIIRSGAKPVPVDITLDGSICPKSILENINKNTKAIFVTQLNGHTCNMDEIIDICNANNIILLEDSAQALGSKYKNKSAGTFGIAGCLSFYPAKILGGPGDGGAIITNNEGFYNWVKNHRDHGRNKNNEIKNIGRNSRLDNLMAAFLNVQLKDFEKTIYRRRKVAEIYYNGLKHLDTLKLPKMYHLDTYTQYEDTFQNYEILAENRDGLRDFLNQNHVGTLIQWGGITINMIGDYFKNSKSNFSVTKEYYDKCIMLPMNTIISDSDIRKVINLICKFYK